MAPARDPALHQSQIMESAGQGPSPSARGIGGGLSAYDLCPSREAVEQARVGFLRKWKLCCKAVSTSFEEAGDELFTFTSFPSSQWKALRTTNALERINEEFRRRTKTQASLPSEEAVLFLLFGLLRSGQVRLRRLVGWQDLTSPQMEAA